MRDIPIDVDMMHIEDPFAFTSEDRRFFKQLEKQLEKDKKVPWKRAVMKKIQELDSDWEFFSGLDSEEVKKILEQHFSTGKEILYALEYLGRYDILVDSLLNHSY